VRSGIEVRAPGRWGHPDSKAAIEVITDSPGDGSPVEGVIADSELAPSYNRKLWIEDLKKAAYSSV